MDKEVLVQETVASLEESGWERTSRWWRTSAGLWTSA
jgi:hypothetical protein